METKKTKMMLPRELTISEKIDLGDGLAKLNQEILKLEAEITDYSKERREAIKELRKDLRVAMQSLINGEIEVEMEVELRFDYDSKVVTTVNPINGEVIEERDMMPSEMQKTILDFMDDVNEVKIPVAEKKKRGRPARPKKPGEE